MRLLAATAHEIAARASLCNDKDAPENAALWELARSLVACATALLAEQSPPRDVGSLQRLQAQLAPTFVGSLLPWLLDSLTLFSAFAFGYSQRLLPLVLPLLQQLKRLTEADAPQRRKEPTSARAQQAQAVPIQCARHPYKNLADKDARKGGRQAKPALRHEEKHEWPGASQLILRFDRRCCTEEGDWLTLRFYKERGASPVHAVRLGGPWREWPSQLVVNADCLHVVFTHTAESPHAAYRIGSAELWGYAFTVTAAKRWMADRLDTPPLTQLRTSLFYLGSRCACLLCEGEPVEKEEKEHVHWLHSPLLSRGLPLQLPGDHPLMNAFFGIKRSAQGDAAALLQRDAQFLNGLTSLADPDAADPGGAGARDDDAEVVAMRSVALLHTYLMGTTPELAERAPHTATSETAARAVLASLLSYNGLAGEAQKAAGRRQPRGRDGAAAATAHAPPPPKAHAAAPPPRSRAALLRTCGTPFPVQPPPPPAPPPPPPRPPRRRRRPRPRHTRRWGRAAMAAVPRPARCATRWASASP